MQIVKYSASKVKRLKTGMAEKHDPKIMFRQIAKTFWEQLQQESLTVVGVGESLLNKHIEIWLRVVISVIEKDNNIYFMLREDVRKGILLLFVLVC